MDNLLSKLKNFWYYYKVHVLIAAAAVLVACYLGSQSWGKPEPDYHIGIVQAVPWTQEALDALKSTVLTLGQDQNGDGEVVVQLHTYFVDLADDSPNAGVNNSQTVASLDADLVGGVSGLFLTDDPETLQRITNGLFPERIPWEDGLYLLLRADASESYAVLAEQWK